MPALATVRDFVCNDWGCKRVATQFHSSYRTAEQKGRSMLDRFERGLVCNIHAGGIKRRWQSRYNSRNDETLTLIAELGPEWEAPAAEYIAKRVDEDKAARERHAEQRRQNELEAAARFAKSWVERSLEVEPDITPGVDYRSYEDHHRDGFTIGGDSWSGSQVVVEQDYRNPATVKVTSMGQWSPMRARAIAKALLMAADLADIRDATNGPKGE